MAPAKLSKLVTELQLTLREKKDARKLEELSYIINRETNEIMYLAGEVDLVSSSPSTAISQPALLRLHIDVLLPWKF